MTPSEILDLEISLLLVRYGKQSALRALARRLGMSDHDLEAELRKLSQANVTLAPKKKSRVTPFSLDPLLIGREDKADTLRLLQARFENRTFLPELKDI